MKFISNVNKISFLVLHEKLISYFPSNYVIFCLFYERRKKIYTGSTYYVDIVGLYVVFDWLAKMMFSHVKKSYFLRVFKYDFSQWPKSLYNTDVYTHKKI